MIYQLKLNRSWSALNQLVYKVSAVFSSAKSRSCFHAWLVFSGDAIIRWPVFLDVLQRGATPALSIELQRKELVLLDFCLFSAHPHHTLKKEKGSRLNLRWAQQWINGILKSITTIIIIIIIVTGDSLRPDLLLISPNNCLYILELTVGFETNLDINSHRKEEKYRPLLKDLNCDYRQVQFANLSMSCLGIFGQSSDSFLEMCKCIGIDQSHLNYILNKI